MSCREEEEEENEGKEEKEKGLFVNKIDLHSAHAQTGCQLATPLSSPFPTIHLPCPVSRRVPSRMRVSERE